jgi:methionyl-tRNA formyltransferase
MRVVFCGSGEFAAPSLRALAAGGAHRIVQVVTQPARPAGRGGKLHPTPIAEAARALGLEPIECPDINAADAVAAIRSAAPDVICVADFGQFVRQSARQCARIDTINLHASLLPALRGAAPINWAIIRGLAGTGVTTFSLVDRMDAGPIYLQADTEVRPDETALELRVRLAELGAAVMCRTLDMLESNQAKGIVQDESRVTLAPKLRKSDGRLEWSADAVSLRNCIHGCWPWPGGRALFRRKDGKDFDVIIARAAAPPDGASGPPGSVDAELAVRTGSGRLRIVEIQPAGKRVMAWRDFVNGYRVSEGDLFAASRVDQRAP